jgi:hypothetical protein
MVKRIRTGKQKMVGVRKAANDGMSGLKEVIQGK